MVKKHNIIVEVNNTGFTAYVEKLDGVVTTGDTIEEIKENMQEALELYYDDKVTLKLSYHFDLKQFFKHYNMLNQKAVAHYAGINESLFSQYISGKKVPSEKQLNKLTEGVNRIGQELANIHF